MSKTQTLRDHGMRTLLKIRLVFYLTIGVLILTYALFMGTAAAAWPYVFGGLTNNYNPTIVRLWEISGSGGIGGTVIYKAGVPIVTGHNKDGSPRFRKALLFIDSANSCSCLFAQFDDGTVKLVGKICSMGSIIQKICGIDNDRTNIYLFMSQWSIDKTKYAIIKLSPKLK